MVLIDDRVRERAPAPNPPALSASLANSDVNRPFTVAFPGRNPWPERSPRMSNADRLAAVLAAVFVALLACHVLRQRRPAEPPDMRTRRRRYKLAWEVRGLVIVVAGPYAAGIGFGYVSTDYALALLLFTASGLVAAEMIAPSGLQVHR